MKCCPICRIRKHQTDIDEQLSTVCQYASPPVGHVCLFVCAKYFRFLTIAWSHIPGPAWSGGVGMGVGVCQKSVFHARAHFCQDIIPWDLFVYAIFCVAFPQLLSASCCCYFSFRFCSPLPSHPSFGPLSIVFYSCQPRGQSPGQLRPEGGQLMRV